MTSKIRKDCNVDWRPLTCARIQTKNNTKTTKPKTNFKIKEIKLIEIICTKYADDFENELYMRCQSSKCRQRKRWSARVNNKTQTNNGVAASLCIQAMHIRGSKRRRFFFILSKFCATDTNRSVITSYLFKLSMANGTRILQLVGWCNGAYDVCVCKCECGCDVVQGFKLIEWGAVGQVYLVQKLYCGILGVKWFSHHYVWSLLLWGGGDYSSSNKCIR